GAGGVFGLARLERSRARHLATRLSGGQATVLLAQGDPPLAAGVRAALLLVRPVQTVGGAQRTEGELRRGAVPARGLARPVGHVGADLARGDRPRHPRKVTASGAASTPPSRPPRRRAPRSSTTTRN